MLLIYFCAYFVLNSFIFNGLIITVLRRYLVISVSGLPRLQAVTFYYYCFIYNGKLNVRVILTKTL